MWSRFARQRMTMSYHEETQGRLRQQQTKQAIALAMQGRWQEAVATNKKIIESFPNDVDTYNRLGKAYMALGEYGLAREAYARAFELDPANVIADKNLRRLSQLRDTVVHARGESRHAGPQHFIEEIGKAGVVNLSYLAPSEVLARMVAGDAVYLRVDGPTLVVENGYGEYLGQVGSKHAQRLIKLMEGGNKYTAAVISSAENRLTVIIREIYQHPSQARQLSFPPRGLEKLQPYVSEKMLRNELEEEEGEPHEIYGVNDEEQGD
jgi:tetratricopeptide (TPR) repeat protein